MSFYEHTNTYYYNGISMEGHKYIFKKNIFICDSKINENLRGLEVNEGE